MRSVNYIKIGTVHILLPVDLTRAFVSDFFSFRKDAILTSFNIPSRHFKQPVDASDSHTRIAVYRPRCSSSTMPLRELLGFIDFNK